MILPVRSPRRARLAIGRLGGAGLLAALLAATLGCAERVTSSDPFNLVVIALDTLRPDHLGLNGYERATSPQLDALARESVVFENAQSVAPWTAPSLVSLMTSLYPEVHGVFRFPGPARLRDEVTTLAEVLQSRGYATAAFTEGGYAKADFGLDQGFAEYARNPGDDESNHSNVSHESRLEANVERSLDWLDDHASERFFLFFHTYEIHYPFRAPDTWIQAMLPDYVPEAEAHALQQIAEKWNRVGRLSDEEWDRLLIHRLHCQLQELPAVEDRKQLVRGVRDRIADLEAGRIAFAPATRQWIRALYDAGIRYTDAEIARIWQALEKHRIEQETIVLVVSDHGEGLGERGRIQHGTSVHQELTRILLLLRLPDAAPGRVTSLVRLIDVMPTLLDVMQIPRDGLVLQGKSAVGLLRGATEQRLAYASALAIEGEELAQRSIRSDRWSYIEDDRTGERSLFDLRADPGERVDRLGAEPEAAADLAARLSEQRAANEALRDSLGVPPPGDELDEKTLDELRALGYVE